MSRVDRIRPEYVELMPKALEIGVLYISEKYATAAHLCCCGCGTKIITPLKPGGWTLSSDAGGVTLYPSVGNWSAACQSHYWIEGGKIVRARGYSKAEIDRNRLDDLAALEGRYSTKVAKPGFWERFWQKFKSWF